MGITPEELLEIRHSMNKFTPLTNETWLEIKDHIELIELDKKNNLINFGEDIYRCGYVLKGLLKYIAQSPNGAECVLQFVGDKQFFGGDGQLRNGVVSGFQAINNTRLAILNNRLIDSSPYIKNLRSKLIEASLKASRAHACSLLLSTPEERYIQFRETYSSFHHKISHSAISEYLGITQVHLSRLKKKVLERESVADA